MRVSPLVSLVLVGAFSLTAHAVDLRVRVSDGKGKPVADAVITVSALDAGTAPSAPAPTSRNKFIDQRDEQFVPYVEIFRPGDRVVFRNSDVTRHHVYSFSPTKTFEMVLRPGESGAPLLLDRVGIVAVGCNIHDHMRTWLFVSTANHIAVTGADGVGQFTALAPGPYRVTSWHPQLRPRQPTVTTDLTLAHDNMTLPVRLSLLPDPRTPMDPSRMQY